MRTRHASCGAIAAITFLVLNAPQASAQELSMKRNWHQPNGPVYAMVRDSATNTIYIGGDFDYVGPPAAYGTPLDTTTGQPFSNLVNPVGAVLTCAPDGVGGWYIAGGFDHVGGVARNGVARINADGTLHSWDPDVSGGAVNVILANAGTVYLGGAFTTVGGQPRNKLAAVTDGTALPTPWDPSADGTVYTLSILGSTMLVGGDFENVGGQPRANLAAVSLSTGAVSPWDPSPNNTVKTLATGPGPVFVGGTFNNIGGQTRYRIAAVDPGTGLATDWYPDIIDEVRALELVDDTLLYVGTSDGVSVFHVNDEDPLSWNLYVSGGELYGMDITDEWAYLAGTFTTVNTYPRPHLARFPRTVEQPDDWNPRPGNQARVVVAAGPSVYVGGGFYNIGGGQRKYVAAIDGTTGEVTPWSANVNDVVRALAVDTDGVYIGGDFDQVNFLTRRLVARLDKVSGQTDTWAPNLTGTTMRAIALYEDRLYIAGGFTNISGNPATGTGYVLRDTGVGSSIWNVSGGIVNTLEVDGDVIYVGGTFTSFYGQPGIGAYDLDALAGLPWDANCNGEVFDIEVVGDVVYVAGYFTGLGGQPRNRVGAVSATTGTATAFNPYTNYQVNAIAVRDDKAYIGGEFSNVGGTYWRAFAEVDATTGLLTSWDCAYNDEVGFLPIVHTILADGPHLHVGGDFYSIDHNPRSFLAVYSNADCLGVPGGPAQPGTPCDDGNAGTENDTWGVNCLCGGQVIDAIAEAGAHASLHAWPSPASSVLNLSEPLDGLVLDAMGRTVRALRRSAQVDVSGLSPGWYVIRAADGRSVRFARE